MSQHGTNFGFTNVSKNIDNYGDISLQNKQIYNGTPCRLGWVSVRSKSRERERRSCVCLAASG